MPTLSIVETANVHELKAKHSHRLAPEAAKARAAFIDAQAKRLAEGTSMSQHAAAQQITRQCEGVLLPDLDLPFDDEELAGCTVGDVLADPDRFEGATLADPLEGVGYGTCKARVMRRADGTPWIHVSRMDAQFTSSSVTRALCGRQWNRRTKTKSLKL